MEVDFKSLTPDSPFYILTHFPAVSHAIVPLSLILSSPFQLAPIALSLPRLLHFKFTQDLKLHIKWRQKEHRNMPTNRKKADEMYNIQTYFHKHTFISHLSACQSQHTIPSVLVSWYIFSFKHISVWSRLVYKTNRSAVLDSHDRCVCHGRDRTDTGKSILMKAGFSHQG